MNRLLVYAAALIAVSLMCSEVMLAQAAQVDPFIGAWRLNLAKSKFDNIQGPDKPVVMTVLGQGDARLVIVEGITPDEKSIAYSYLIDWAGSKKSPIAGTGAPNGEDTIAANKVDDHTIETTGTKAGSVVYTSKMAVSEDGKTMTITSEGTNKQGMPTHAATVWDKK